MKRTNKRAIIFLAFLMWLSTLLLIKPHLHAYPYNFRDSRGLEITIARRPERVVSLVPSITEIIFKLGAGDSVIGVTYHSVYPPEVNLKKVVGGFFSPSLKAIEALRPEVIFVSRHHTSVVEKFSGKNCILINLETRSLAESFRNIQILGKIFGKEEQAQGLIAQIKEQIQLIKKKVAKIPASERKRVIRLMGRGAVMAPGDDSFQNEMIKAAGGIPPAFGKKGHVVAVTKEEWLRFNPQVIYGCGGDRSVAKKLLAKEGWRDVEAVKNGQIFFFPCDLTCRAATRTGHFVQWLASTLYPEYFGRRENQVLEEKVVDSRPLRIPLEYVRKAKIVYSRIYDFQNKTLIIDFVNPMKIVSTLEGQRDGITSVGNHYSPPPCWGIGHSQGLAKIRKRIYSVIKRDEESASFLFTGADMDNLAIERASYRDMEVYALVTAGVRSNAVRMASDPGRYYEPGTINIIVMTNMQLTSRAMTRAIITATEAKTAALADLDIRSSQSPRLNQATGTGTDNIIVVQGTGTNIDNTGGHSKMGELIAKAVYQGVQEAVFKQNGIIRKRNVFQRLRERRINIFELVSETSMNAKISKAQLLESLEELLLQPKYAAFVETALALSDAYEKGLINELTSFRSWCITIAQEIAGKRDLRLRDLLGRKDIPPALAQALNAMLNGLYARQVSDQS